MRPDLFRDEYTKVLIPKGELLRDFMNMMAKCDCEITPTSPGSLAFTLLRLALPLLFVATRARDVQKILDSSDANFGFTGTDIVAEQGLSVENRLPSSVLSAKTDVVFASTPNWNERVDKPSKYNFPSMSTVVTPYPNLTSTYLSENVIPAQVNEVLGATEGLWWADTQNTAVVDVRVSGDTMKSNRIIPVETVLEDVTLALIKTNSSQKTESTAKDSEVVETLMKRLRQSMRRK